MAKARQNARMLARNDKFKVVLQISHAVKQPVTHFMRWADKQQSIWNKARKLAEEQEFRSSSNNSK